MLLILSIKWYLIYDIVILIILHILNTIRVIKSSGNKRNLTIYSKIILSNILIVSIYFPISVNILSDGDINKFLIGLAYVVSQSIVYMLIDIRIFVIRRRNKKRKIKVIDYIAPVKVGITIIVYVGFSMYIYEVMTFLMNI